jgi:hypothetical protein
MNKKIIGIASTAMLIIIGVASYVMFKPHSPPAGSPTSYQVTPYTVEILYLPHPPAEAIVKKVEPIIAQFQKYTVKEFSFDDPSAKSITDKYKLTEHMPIVIFIGGKDTFDVGGKKIELKNFPKGDAFVPAFEGGWSYDDLKTILQTRN